MTFTSAPYSIRFIEGERDPVSGDYTGVFVYKVKVGTVAGRALRAGDKLIEVNGYDVSGCGLNDVAAVLADPESVPSPEAPSTLTFLRVRPLQQ